MYITAYVKGDSSALECLLSLGFIEKGEPMSRGYVLYKALKSGLDVVDAVRSLEWRDFEELLRLIFADFGYNVAANVRLNCGGIAEFDLIAWNKELAIVVEAKRWKVGGARWQEVARRHLEKMRRCRLKLLAFAPAAAPLVVTSTATNFIAGGVPVVSIENVGHFLTSLDYLKDQIAMLK